VIYYIQDKGNEMENNFYYVVEYHTVRTHKRTGKVISDYWIKQGEYPTLEEAIADNPPCDGEQRISKEYYELIYSIPSL
jgi:hypothetical protein